MTTRTLIELAIGLSFLYLMLSVLSSSLVEYLAQKKGWRGRCMRAGLRRLIEDRWMYMAVIRHPMVASLYRHDPGRPKPPSYMPPENFADSLLDVLLKKAIDLDPASGLDRNAQQTPGSYAQAARICADAGYAVAGAVLPFLTQASTIEAAKLSIGKWYDTTMVRVSGGYKRDTKRRLFQIGLAVAILFNVDSIAITTQMLKSSTTRAAMADLATATLCPPGSEGDGCVLPEVLTPQDLAGVKTAVINTRAELTRMADAGVPLGYACLGGVTKTTAALSEDLRGAWAACKAAWVEKSIWQLSPELILRLIGWFITAMAISFGAEFWFALVSRFINLRGSGPKPRTAAENAS